MVEVRKIEGTEMRLNSVSIVPSYLVGDRVSLDSAAVLELVFSLPQPPHLSQELFASGWRAALWKRAALRKRASTVERCNCLSG